MAPQELPLFGATSEAYFEDPDKVMKQQAAQDEMLGFGMEETLTLLTPAILSVVTQVVAFITSEARKHLKTESSNVVADLVKRMFKRFLGRGVKPPPEAPPMTSELLNRVREVTLRNAFKLELPEAQATLLADAVVGSLAIAPAAAAP
jgi:hypothetical protein